MNNNRFSRLFCSTSLIGSGLLLSGIVWASGTSDAPPAPAMAAAPVIAPAPVPVEPAYQSYVYYGDRYRDPFIALNSDVRSDASMDRAPAVASLSLKGIIQDSRGRMALLTGGVNSYILRDGRLFDGRNRMVKGISGVIKTDSVIMIGSDRTVKELRAKPAL